MVLTADLDVLFSPCMVGPRVSPNRIVAQAMEACEGTESGGVSERTLSRYLRLAEGGWGVVFLEATSVTPRSRGRLRGLLLTASTAAGFESLVRRFKALNPEALLLLQLTHSGRQTHPSMDCVTVLPGPPEGVRYLESEEIALIRDEFVEGVMLADKVGFDGVDVKLCHGYLTTELLRPANVRADGWGGAFRQRIRFVEEVYERIGSRKLSDGFLIGSRMSFYEKRPGGCGTSGPSSLAFDPSESLEVVRLLAKSGAHYVNISGSGPEGLPSSARPEERRIGTLYSERLATECARAEQLGVTVIGTGYTGLGESVVGVGASRVRWGAAQMLGFGRQAFADPHFPRKLRQGEPVDWCRKCGSCAKLMVNQFNAGCVVHDTHYGEQLRRLRDQTRPLR